MIEKSAQKIVLITGATSGFGKIVACALANENNVVIVSYRSKIKADLLLDYFTQNYPNAIGRIELIEMDLCSLESIRKACEQIQIQYDRIDTLINNAGIMSFAYAKTQDGIEETLQTNLLAPLLITDLLLPTLMKSKDAKLIFTASGLHQGPIRLDDLEFSHNFSSYKSYSHSKLGIILMTRLLSAKLQAKGIGVYAQHPGMVNTDLGRKAGTFSRLIFKLLGTTPEKGARNLIYLANTAKSELVSGEYYDSKKVKVINEGTYDLDLATRLLDRCKVYLQHFISTPSLIFA